MRDYGKCPGTVQDIKEFPCPIYAQVYVPGFFPGDLPGYAYRAVLRPQASRFGIYGENVLQGISP
jgi:hypothetical protein